LLIIRSDGSAAAVTIDRNSNVVAWSLLTTDGEFCAALVLARELFVLARRGADTILERLDETLSSDAAVTATSDVPKVQWDLPSHLSTGPISVLADGSVPSSAGSAGGVLTLGAPALSVIIGRSFTHEIEALPLVASTGADIALDARYRPVRIVFRLLESTALTVDTGVGPVPLPLPTLPSPFTGDVATHALGWRRGIAASPWRVVQDLPVPCTILAVTTDIEVNE
jgi:hypothetical protein